MSYVAPSLLSHQNTASNIGGICSLRLAYSSNVKQQRFQTDSEIDVPLKFLRSNKFLTGWTGKYLQALLGIEEVYSENGFEENYSFSAYLDSFCTEEAFRAWWTKYLKGRRIAAELTDMNGAVRIINPFIITYQYIGTRDYPDQNRYVLTFKRAKLIATSIYNFDIIKTVTTRTFNYAGVLNNECTIILMDNCDQELFVFGYSEQNNISVVIFQNDPKDNILYNIPDGTYWFFAQNQLIPDLYDSMRVKITAGEIEIIPDSIENPQIITEDETVNDEGTIVPE